MSEISAVVIVRKMRQSDDEMNEKGEKGILYYRDKK